MKNMFEVKKSAPITQELLQNKIRMLMCMSESFLKNLPLAQPDNLFTDVNYILDETYKRGIVKQSLDGEWAKQKFQSFQNDVFKILDKPRIKEALYIWFKKEMQLLGAFQLSEYFQKSKIIDDHCMGFVYQFLNNDKHAYICNFNISIQDRIAKYVNLEKKTSLDKLKTGDFVIYEKEELGHIALFIGVVNDVPYVISHYGWNFKAFIHPISHVGDNYGQPLFFSNDTVLSDICLNKFEIVKRELALHLNQPCAPKLSNKSNAFFGIAIKKFTEPSEQENEFMTELRLCKTPLN